MPSVVGGGLFSAIAFAGAGYVFHKLDKNGCEKEMEGTIGLWKKKNGTKKLWKRRTR